MRKVVFGFVAAAFVLAAPASLAAAETWKGTISDAMCAKRHAADEHGATKETGPSCVEKCIKGGGEYVFVTGDKILKIANQDFKELKAHGGHYVELTGELKDGSITVSKIVAPKAEKK
jgi:hypothetical protein